MSGTSMDAVDTALVEFDKKAVLKKYRQYPIEEQLRFRVRNINANSPLCEVAALDNQLGQVFASAVNSLLEETGIDAENIKCIGSHGQTIFHQPDLPNPTSVQIGDPNILCARTGITIVSDFRRMDMAMGGQGAPLAPVFHEYQFGSGKRHRAVINLGGIANITVLRAKDRCKVSGFDTGPGNGLLDDWNYLHNKTAMDKDGEWARAGKVLPELLQDLLADPYFASEPPKSTGRDYFNLDWLNKHLSKHGQPNATDVQATLLELSVKSIANAVDNYFPEVEELFICGGGAHNKFMLAKLQSLLPGTSIDTTDKLGIDPDAVEAVTFAWLGYRRINNLALDLSLITGAKKKILPGAVYTNN